MNSTPGPVIPQQAAADFTLVGLFLTTIALRLDLPKHLSNALWLREKFVGAQSARDYLPGSKRSRHSYGWTRFSRFHTKYRLRSKGFVKLTGSVVVRM